MQIGASVELGLGSQRKSQAVGGRGIPPFKKRSVELHGLAFLQAPEAAIRIARHPSFCTALAHLHGQKADNWHGMPLYRPKGLISPRKTTCGDFS